MRPMESQPPAPKGRGSHLNPPNRFGGPHHVPDLEHVEHDQEYLDSLANKRTIYLPDYSRSVVSENDSPDVGFRFSINPYRGCQHGCSYCYARPTHEYLDLNAGLDFETRIFVKHEAPRLLREFLTRDSWRPEVIALSGVTDPYQPIERELQLSRGCLEVFVEARHPVTIITKNALILRDLDLLRQLAAEQVIHVNVSVTTLDAELARVMEPRTSTPTARLNAIRELSAAGIPVRALIAPIIPGLNDSEIPALLEAVGAAGARAANYILLRLPLTVAPVFVEWLERTQPERKERILGRIRSVRAGKLNNPEFGKRMRGTGELADQIRNLFRLFARRRGLDGDLPPYDYSRFVPPRSPSGQGWLFK